jgi:hypothetical protein
VAEPMANTCRYAADQRVPIAQQPVAIKADESPQVTERHSDV